MTNLWLGSPKKRERTQVNNVRNEKEEITTVNTEVQKTIREYPE